MSQKVSVRRTLARGTVAAGLVTALCGVTTHLPALAAPGGTLEIKAICNGDGSPSGYAHLIEQFNGLDAGAAHGNPAYEVVAVRSGDNASISEPYWYPADDGSHVSEPNSDTVSVGVTGDDPDIKQGQSFAWQLDKIQGVETIVLSGTIGVDGPTCVKYEKPKKATFGSSPASITVSKKGSFKYPFKATAGLKGTVTVSSGSSHWAMKHFKVPANGAVKAKLTLTKKAFKKLKKAGKATTDVAVKLLSGTFHTTAHHALALKAP